MTNRNPTIPRRTRIFLGIAVWLALALLVPFYAKTPEWRCAGLVLAAGFATILATYLKPKPEPRDVVPRVKAKQGPVEDLAVRAVERADKTMVGWLTIVGALHSAFLAAAASNDRLDMLGLSTNPSLSGAAFLVLGLVCYAGYHAITTTRSQAHKALKVAGRLEGLGRYFDYVYADESKTPATTSLMVSLLQALGYIWLALGATLGLLAYLLNVL